MASILKVFSAQTLASSSIPLDKCKWIFSAKIVNYDILNLLQAVRSTNVESKRHFHCLSKATNAIQNTSLCKCLPRQNIISLKSRFCHKEMNTEDKLKHFKNRSFKDSASLVLQNTLEVDVMASSLLPSSVENLIQQLYSSGIDQEDAEYLLSGRLWLLRQPEATLEVCKLLQDHGMSPHLVCLVTSNIPYYHYKDLKQVPAVINNILLNLRSFGFSEKEIYALVRKDNSVLFVSDESLRTSMSLLKAFFTPIELKKVVFSTPGVLDLDSASIKEKYGYIVNKMGYENGQILNSEVFSHSIEHIQDRHLFLFRAGVFKKVNKKLSVRLNPNPPLRQVVDWPDALFVKLVEGVGVEDYTVFVDMREIEREAEISDSDSSDSDLD